MNNASASLRGNMTMSLVEELISSCSELWLGLPMVSTGGGGVGKKNPKQLKLIVEDCL